MNQLPQICDTPRLINPPQILNPLPCDPTPQICNSLPKIYNSETQVIVDNSLSTALANALQMLLMNNLIEKSMKLPCGCDSIQGQIYPPIIDYLNPQVDYINPYAPCEPIITPCEVIPPCPCEQVVEVIPNVYYPEVMSIPNIGCGCEPNYIGIPNYGCGCDQNFVGIPNYGCGCEYGQNYGVPYGCGYDVSPYGLPNVGCGCGKIGKQNIGELLASMLGSRFGCDGLIPSCGCSNLDPLSLIESCLSTNKYGIY